MHITNTAGTKRATLKIIAMDKPSAPVGPIKFNEITAESVTISWSPPEQDGGSAITHYIVDKLDANLGWIEVSSFVVRLSQKITRLVTGQEYIFRVRAVNKFGVSGALESEPVLADHPFTVPSAPGVPEAVGVSKDAISIKWSEPESDGGSPIIGFVNIFSSSHYELRYIYKSPHFVFFSLFFALYLFYSLKTSEQAR